MKIPREMLDKELMYHIHNPERQVVIDKLISEIDTYYKSKVPKKKDVSIDINSPIGAREEAFNEGYNQCLADFHKET